MRAPRHPQSCALTEAAMDDLADKLGMDPLEFRLKNLNPGDFHTPIYEAELKMGAELIGWREKSKPAGRPAPARSAMGWVWPCTSGAAGVPRTRRCRARLTPMARSSLQRNPGYRHRRTHHPGDHRGGSARSEADRHFLEHRHLGLSARAGVGRFNDDTVDGPALLRRGPQGRDALFVKIATAVKAQPADLSLKDGQLWVSGEPVMSWKDACRKLGTATISEIGSYQPASRALASAAVSSPKSPLTSRRAW